MALSLNKVCLLGRVGTEPEIRHLQDGARVTSFTLATSESWIDKKTNERQERTQWHKISIFNEGIVGIVEKYVKKGSRIYIEGQLQTRKWQDQTGQDRYVTEIVLQPYRGEIILLDGKNDPLSESSAGSSKSDDIDDDIPY